MKKRLLGAGGLLLVALGVAAWFIAQPPSRRSSGDLKLHRLAEGVYSYRGVFSASGVLVLPGGVVVVDSQVSPGGAERLRAEIARVTPLPVTHVINTHYHGDHVGGNAAFPGAEIIATAQTARLVVERDGERVEYADTFGLAFQQVHPIVPPTRTFEGRLELQVGGETLEVLQLGRVETPDACVVWWPSRRVVLTGDGVATFDYPWTGVPFLDEGLQPDGEWVGFFAKVKALKPVLLVPGHGPALAGEAEIAARLDLLSALFTDLFDAARPRVEAGLSPQTIFEEVDRELAHYRERDDLAEKVVSQRFAIFKAVNGLMPDRRGKGWWHDFRPSVIARAPVEEALRELEGLDGEGARLRAVELVEAGRRPLAISVLEVRLASNPEEAASLGLLSDVLLDGMVGVTPYVDASEYFAASTRVARAALRVDPHQPLALLNLGAAEVWGGMVLAQPMGPAIGRLEEALATPGLTAHQQRKGDFFLGKAHQLEGRDGDSDTWYRKALPAGTRFLFPLVRERIRAFP